MKWLRKRKNKESKGWADVTLAQFTEVERILKSKTPTMEMELKRAIYGEEGGAIAFLNEPIRKKNIKKDYWIHGRQYRTSADLSRLTMSQYIDASNSKTNRDLLSVLLIPYGHAYNDGYDMEEVKADIDHLDMVTVQSIAFFLSRQLATFGLCMADYLERKAERKETNPMSLTDQATSVMWRSMAGLILSQGYVKDSTTHRLRLSSLLHRR